MSDLWIDPTACHSLAILVESVTAPMLVQHAGPVCLELDIDVELKVPADPKRTVDLVRSLVKQSLEEMSDGGDLTITACETVCGIELEFADTGRDVARRSQSRPMAVAAIGANLIWKNCPQGGGSVTVTFPKTDVASQRNAA